MILRTAPGLLRFLKSLRLRAETMASVMMGARAEPRAGAVCAACTFRRWGWQEL